MHEKESTLACARRFSLQKRSDIWWLVILVQKNIQSNISGSAAISHIIRMQVKDVGGSREPHYSLTAAFKPLRIAEEGSCAGGA